MSRRTLPTNTETSASRHPLHASSFNEIVTTQPNDYRKINHVNDDHFVGLGLDEDNESDQTENRIQHWLAKVLVELGIVESSSVDGAS